VAIKVANTVTNLSIKNRASNDRLLLRNNQTIYMYSGKRVSVIINVRNTMEFDNNRSLKSEGFIFFIILDLSFMIVNIIIIKNLYNY